MDSSVDEDAYASTMLVTKNVVARTQVPRVRKSPAPRPPKTCWLPEPPSAAVRPPLFPGWIRMMRMSTTAQKTCRPVRGVSRISSMKLISFRRADDLQKGVCLEGGAAHERAVQVRTGEQLSSVVGLYT